MQLRRAWKPIILATAFAATSLFYSCKKDPTEIWREKQKPGIADTNKWENKKILDLKMAKIEPLADTVHAVPLKRQSDVVLAKPA